MDVLGKQKPENQENKCLFVQNLEAGKNPQLFTGGIQANVNASGESGSQMFPGEKVQYLKVNHSNDSGISAVSHDIQPFNVCQARKQQQTLIFYCDSGQSRAQLCEKLHKKQLAKTGKCI